MLMILMEMIFSRIENYNLFKFVELVNNFLFNLDKIFIEKNYFN